jgi:hypothetical protein
VNFLRFENYFILENRFPYFLLLFSDPYISRILFLRTRGLFYKNYGPNYNGLVPWVDGGLFIGFCGGTLAKKTTTEGIRLV